MPSLVLDNSVAMRWCFKDGSDSDLMYAEKVLDRLTDTLFLAFEYNKYNIKPVIRIHNI